jgi:hypothetical protein
MGANVWFSKQIARNLQDRTPVCPAVISGPVRALRLATLPRADSRARSRSLPRSAACSAASLGQEPRELEVGHADGLVDVAQGVLGDVVLRAAQHQADGGAVLVLVPHGLIDSGQVEVELARVFGMSSPAFSSTTTQQRKRRW